MERLEKALRKALNTPEGAALSGPVRLPDQPGPPEASRARPTRSSPPQAPGAAAFWQSLSEVRPSLRALSRGLVVTAADEPDAGHFELLGAKLMHQVRAHGWRRIGIAAPRSGCGATTVALNLAFGLSQQTDLRILLVEADLRRPSMGRTLGLRPRAGLAELVDGRAEPNQALLRLRSNLATLLAPPPRGEPRELLSLPESLAAIERIESLLDPSVILIDLPPMLGEAGAVSFWEGLDGVLLVAAAGSTTIPEIEACRLRMGDRASLIGVVLNRCLDPDRIDGPGPASRRRGGWGVLSLLGASR